VYLGFILSVSEAALAERTLSDHQLLLRTTAP
jgi:hypothetical protein